MGVEQFILLGAAPGELAKNQTAIKSGAFSTALSEELSQPGVGWPPDMAQLNQRLQERFVALRSSGALRQTPSHFWYRDWRGNEGTLGMGQYAPVADAIASAPPSLEFRQRRELVKALLACEHLANPKKRQKVIDDLQPAIRHNIPHDDAALEHVDNLIRTALRYPYGIEDVLYVVEGYESDSLAWQELSRVVARLLPVVWANFLRTDFNSKQTEVRHY